MLIKISFFLFLEEKKFAFYRENQYNWECLAHNLAYLCQN